MSEIRSLNGYPLADTAARESISQLGSDINGIKNNYVSSGQLTQAVEGALQVAKDSGAFDGPAGADGAKGDPGKDGTSVKISSIVESQEPGGANEVTFSDGNRLSVKNGSNGTAGANGVGIQSVVQTTTSTTDGGSNVITVTKTDGNKSTFTVKNGSKGSTGADGVGISSVKQTTTSSADDGNNVVTVTLTNGATSTFTVKNGSKGSAGADGASGKDGYTPVKGKDYFDGDDGVSPTVTVTTIAGGHSVSITDVNGTKTFTVMNGEPSGYEEWVFTLADGTSVTKRVVVLA